MSAAFARSAHARYSELALTWERPPQEGDSCKAVMVEDGQWHDAVLRGIDMAETPIYTVEFTEYPGKTASVGRRELCLTADGTDSDGDEGGSGTCELCARTLPLTRHHLVPRKTHARLKKKGLTVDQLMASAYICRHGLRHLICPCPLYHVCLEVFSTRLPDPPAPSLAPVPRRPAHASPHPHPPPPPPPPHGLAMPRCLALLSCGWHTSGDTPAVLHTHLWSVLRKLCTLAS